MLTWINAGAVLVICAFYPSQPLPAYTCSGGPARANKNSGPGQHVGKRQPGGVRRK